MTEPVAVVTITIAIAGWVCGIIAAVIFAIVGRIPWSVPFTCAPIFAFTALGCSRLCPR
jgi:hypothetical protein